MLVKNILGDKGREVISISSDATLSEATRLLSRRRIGAIVVRDEAGALAGILSERDVVRAVADESVTALARPVSLYMTRAVATCSETDSIEELIGDVVKTRIAETVQEAASLREYITGA